LQQHFYDISHLKLHTLKLYLCGKYSIQTTTFWSLCAFIWFKHVSNSSLFNEFVFNLGFFWHEWANLKLECNESFNGPRVPKRAQFTQERVEYKVFLFDEPLKGRKSLKMFKISSTFRFDKLSNLSKSIQRRKFSDSDSVDLST
jgi:hypothetical protein